MGRPTSSYRVAANSCTFANTGVEGTCFRTGRVLTYFPVVCLYEFLALFPDEVRLFWSGRVTGAIVLFLVNRYSALLINLYTFAAFLPISGYTVSTLV